jgi:predicted MFS family arabinose efflux permease
VPIAAGLALLAAFLVWERRAPEPMMPLHLFAIRNFAAGNLVTLSLYGGLSVSTFFIVVFLQQVGGYTPIAAGLSLLPITLLLFALSRRFGALAHRLGPRLFMAGGPLLAAAGLLLFARATAHPSYATVVLPGVVVFGIGLAATVAPLTAAVLGSVPTGHSGLASGANNAVSRIAGLLAIAAVGAGVSAGFSARLVHDLGHSPAARTVLEAARTKPLVTNLPGVPATFHAALVDASVHAFRLCVVLAAALAALGGLIALIGIENPRFRTPPTR